MDGRYLPNKTKLALTETRMLLNEYKKKLNEANKALEMSLDSLKFARDKLIEKEEENRNLKLIILRMTEQEGRNERL